MPLSLSVTLLLLVFSNAVKSAGWFSGALASDETVQLADTTARMLSKTEARAHVHAWVFEKEPRRGALPLFAKFLGIDRKQITPSERVSFEARARLFFVDVQAGKKVSVIDGLNRVTTLPKTDGFGATQGDVSLPVQPGRWLSFTVQGPEKHFAGRALLVSDVGLSVISDIDDTIRDTNVLDRHEMLMNTFVRPLKSVSGMSARYQQASRVGDVSFHYVSNGPFALYPLLHDFLKRHGFPEGSLHLRAVSAKSGLWNKLFHPDQFSTHKFDTIARLMQDFPRRQFVLIGDTGEHDPEIYADIARRYPAQVQMIWLRQVHAPGAHDQMLATLMQGLPAEKWRAFYRAEEITLLPEESHD